MVSYRSFVGKGKGPSLEDVEHQMGNEDIKVEIGTEVPLGGATGLKLVGRVVEIDGESAKVEGPHVLLDRWYPVHQIRSAIAANS